MLAFRDVCALRRTCKAFERASKKASAPYRRIDFSRLPIHRARLVTAATVVRELQRFPHLVEALVLDRLTLTPDELAEAEPKWAELLLPRLSLLSFQFVDSLVLLPVEELSYEPDDETRRQQRAWSHWVRRQIAWRVADTDGVGGGRWATTAPPPLNLVYQTVGVWSGGTDTPMFPAAWRSAVQHNGRALRLHCPKNPTREHRAAAGKPPADTGLALFPLRACPREAACVSGLCDECTLALDAPDASCGTGCNLCQTRAETRNLRVALVLQARLQQQQ